MSAPYEPPPSPELRLDTTDRDIAACVEDVLSHLTSTGVLATG